MWHVSSRSGVSTLRTATHLLLTYPRTLTTWHCPHSSATAAAIDRYLLPPPGPQQQTCSGGFAAAGPRWDTDGQTQYRLINPAPHAMWAVPTTMVRCCPRWVGSTLCPIIACLGRSVSCMSSYNHRGTIRKQSYGDNRKMAAGYAYRI